MTNVFPIYHIGLIQAWFAALLVYRKPNKGAADKLLVVWLAIIGFEMLYSLLNANYFTQLPDLIIIPLSYGPFLYFYTKLLISKKPVRPNKMHHHLIPTYLFILIALIWIKPIDIDAVNFFGKGVITWLAVFNFTLFLAIMLYYWRALLLLIRKHNRTLGDHFSYRSEAIMLNWLKSSAFWILGGVPCFGFNLYRFFDTEHIPI